ncbi:MAG: ABC transporter ATP-binding protein [bacterium]|nr:ABC transporter ATP-binding protein [bacterium]
MSEPLLRLEGVTRDFPGFRLDRVSFTLEPGYVMGLVGPNGAGKTTTIKLILGLLRMREGTITVFGMDSRKDSLAIKRQVGYLGERVALPESVTSRWVASFLSRCFPDWDDSRFEGYLNRFGVPRDKPVRALSKGNRTKLALAAALAHRPRLVILDEPTSGLDPLIRHEVIESLRDVVAGEDRSVLFSTHIVSDLEAIADFVTVINDGRVVASEPRDRLTERWRRLTFRVEDATGRPDARLLDVRRQGATVTAVTGEYGVDLLQTLRQVATGPVEAAAMGLEEVFRYLVGRNRPNGVDDR